MDTTTPIAPNGRAMVRSEIKPDQRSENWSKVSSVVPSSVSISNQDRARPTARSNDGSSSDSPATSLIQPASRSSHDPRLSVAGAP